MKQAAEGLAPPQILVVEDEGIIAHDIQHRLKSLGYAVSAIVASGEEALEQAERLRPDLVLMDLVLRGKLSGIETAQQMRDRFDIPVVYLTAYADTDTLQRAKFTEPFGYLLKPFEERELHTTIETALYKHEMERRVRDSRQWFETTLRSIGDAVIALDMQGRISFMNRVAEALTGWTAQEAQARPLSDIFNILDRRTSRPAAEPAMTPTGAGLAAYLSSPETRLVDKTGAEHLVDVNATLVKNESGAASGGVLVFRDVTERKRAEEALRESQRALATLMSNLPGMAYRCRNDGAWTMEFVSEGALRLTGYLPSDLLKGQPVSYDQLIHPADRPRVSREVQAAIEERRPYEVSYRITTAGGEEEWVLEQGRGVFGADGTLAALEGFITNITQRKQAEGVLRRSHEELERRVRERTSALTQANLVLQEQIHRRRRAERELERLAAFPAQSPNVVIELEASGIVTYLNPVALAAFPDLASQGTRHPVLHGILELTTELRRAGQTSSVREIALGESIHEQQVWVTPDDLLIRLFMRDVTARRRAEETIRRYAEVVRNMQIGIMVWHPQRGDDAGSFRLLTVNPAALELLGLPTEALVGKSLAETFPGLLGSDVAEACGQVARTRRTSDLGEVRYRQRNGTERIFLVKAFPVADDCVGVAFENITERKRVEHEILQISSRERDRIGQDLHDGLCQQLTGIAFMGKVVEQQLVAKKRPEAAKMVEINQLVNQAILEARGLAAGLHPVELEANGLMAALTQLTANAERLFRIRCRFECAQPVLVHDHEVAIHLYRISQEAVHNAVKHGKPTELTLALYAQDGRLTLQVKDNGVGFSSTPAHPAQPNSGMGLRIMDYRARMIGGALQVEPGPGGGTLVTCSLRHEERHEAGGDDKSA